MLNAVVAWAAVATRTPAIAEDAALGRFLVACAAKFDSHASELRACEIVRPFRAYTTKKVWYQIAPSLKILENGGWLLSPESDLTPISYTKDDIEVTFGPQGQRLTVFVERIPAAIRSLRDRRTRFLEDLDFADIGYAPLFGEGLANEVLFPFGEHQKLYFVSGEYLGTDTKRAPFMLTAFGRAEGKIVKLWESKLVIESPSARERGGTLANYLSARKWRLKEPLDAASSDLSAKAPLSYRSENSGDGGVDIGIVDAKGYLRLVRNVSPRGEVVTLPEERYLRTR